MQLVVHGFVLRGFIGKSIYYRSTSGNPRIFILRIEQILVETRKAQETLFPDLVILQFAVALLAHFAPLPLVKWQHLTPGFMRH